MFPESDGGTLPRRNDIFLMEVWKYLSFALLSSLSNICSICVYIIARSGNGALSVALLTGNLYM